MLKGSSGGKGQDDNPFSWEDVCKNIEENLLKDGYERGKEYEIMLVPNVTNITYGRGVGYVFEEESFDEEISSISATKIRSELREKGKALNYSTLKESPAFLSNLLINFSPIDAAGV